jgi:hypothetical protein
VSLFLAVTLFWSPPASTWTAVSPLAAYSHLALLQSFIHLASRTVLQNTRLVMTLRSSSRFLWFFVGRPTPLAGPVSPQLSTCPLLFPRPLWPPPLSSSTFHVPSYLRALAHSLASFWNTHCPCFFLGLVSHRLSFRSQLNGHFQKNLP